VPSPQRAAPPTSGAPQLVHQRCHGLQRPEGKRRRERHRRLRVGDPAFLLCLGRRRMLPVASAWYWASVSPAGRLAMPKRRSDLIVGATARPFSGRSTPAARSPRRRSPVAAGGAPGLRASAGSEARCGRARDRLIGRTGVTTLHHIEREALLRRLDVTPLQAARRVTETTGTLAGSRSSLGPKLPACRTAQSAARDSTSR
jgi:hypothetical protein